MVRTVSPLDPDACYRALVARDARFDGLFFVGVKTTGIYCRPVCRARTPGRDRCLFFRTAAAGGGGRVPLLLPLPPGAGARRGARRRGVAGRRGGDAPHRGGRAVARRAGRRSGRARSASPARHLRRAMQAELGVSPLALAESRRLALARQLIVDTALPMTEVAFASGFRSVRRFNAAVKARYGALAVDDAAGRARRRRRRASRSPSRCRTARPTTGPRCWATSRRAPSRASSWCVTASTCAPPPSARGAAGSRSRPTPTRPALRATISTSLAGALMTVVARLRRLFDLDAEPGGDRRAPRARSAPRGARPRAARAARRRRLRPVRGGGARRARTAGEPRRRAHDRGAPRRRLGEAIATPHPELTRVFPRAGASPAASARRAGGAGRPARRAATLRAHRARVSTAARSRSTPRRAGAASRADRRAPGRRSLDRALPRDARARLARRVPGGRSRPAPGAGRDLGARRRARSPSAWRPWRAYGATHLWTELGTAAAARAHSNPIHRSEQP